MEPEPAEKKNDPPYSHESLLEQVVPLGDGAWQVPENKDEIREAAQTSFSEYGRENMKGKNQRGFSLIELLVVVAIILIIAAIAIPNLLKAKGSANAASAVSSLRAVTSASQLYSNQFNGFPPSLNAMGPGNGTALQANLLDGVISGCIPPGGGATTCPGTADTAAKSGFTFQYIPGTEAPIATYLMIALPAAGAPSGLSSYCTDNSGVILSDPAGATAKWPTAAAGGCNADTSAAPI